MLFSGNVFAQAQNLPIDFKNIMDSPRQFRSALAEGKTREAALSNARKQLIESIFVRIDASTEVSKQEDNSGFKENYASVVQTSSKMSLTGLRDLTHQEGDTFYVLVYITNGNLRKSLDNWKTSVLEWVGLGESYEQRGLVALSMRPYYSAYLAASKLYPEPISYQFFDKPDSSGDIVPILYEKITTVLKNIEIQSAEPKFDPFTKEYVIKLKPTVFGKTLKNVEVGYESQDGSMWVPASVEGTYVPMFNPPSNRYALVSAFFSPHERTFLEDHSELKVFANLPPDQVLTVRKMITVDFSPIIKIDFTTKIEEQKVTFTPKFEHVSPASFSWSLGDGNEGKGSLLTHTYEKPGVYEVTLKLNESDDLVFTKKVYVGVEKEEAPVPQSVITENVTTVTQPVETPTVTEPVNTPEPEPAPEPEPPKAKPIVLTDADYTASDVILNSVKKGMKTKTVLDWVRQQANAGQIYFGKKDADFVDPEGAVVIIADPKSSVEDILVFRKGVFGQLSEKKQVDDLSGYKGKIAVWVVAKE